MKNSIIKANIPLYIAVQLESKESYESIWIPLPVTKEYLYGTIGCSWDDIRISEYNTSIPGLCTYRLMQMPFAVVNHLAARLNVLSDEHMLKLTAIMSDFYRFDTAEQIIDYTYNPDKYTLLSVISTSWQLGQHRLSELDLSGFPPALTQSIDEIRFGNKIACQEDGWFTPLGYVFSKDGWKKTAKKRRIPACFDIKDKNGEDIYGKWFSDEELENSDYDYFDDEESEDEV